MKVCPRCYELKQDEEFGKSNQAYCRDCRRKYCLEWRSSNRTRSNKWSSNSRARDKIKVVEYYSNGTNSCAICGFSDIRALSIDHIDGGGTKDRENKREQGSHFYNWLIHQGYPGGFQVLCMNCQFIKRSERREYANV